MIVLSLFDGMSCGRVALERAGVDVRDYYASEIDKYATKVSHNNYSNIVRLGDVNDWESWNIPWESIDLLIGGFPCQSFSSSGKQGGFNDERGQLFWRCVEILQYIQHVNPEIKFMFENVKMSEANSNIISEALGVDPVLINSSLVSAQMRQRSYWANWSITQPKAIDIKLQDVLEYGFVDREKSYCIDANYHKGGDLNQYFNKSRRQLIFDKPVSCFGDAVDVGYRKLTPLECERLQTLPEGFSEGVSNTQRYKMIGNGWTVDVIAHILKLLPK